VRAAEQFVEKVQDFVGLYLNPPDKALVLSVDEKSQVQALDRTQPGLPKKKPSRHHDARLQAPSKLPFTSTSNTTMPTPNPSSGPNPPNKSSRKSPVRERRSKQSLSGINR